MKLSKSHKDKIIGGLITVILSALGLYINHSFEKPDSKSKGNSTAFQAYDTSNQTIIQSSQNNTNVGNVSNEYIGTKNVIHEQIPKSNSANRGTKQSEINIEGNNGSNINTAPIQGNLTQIINPNQKNLKKGANLRHSFNNPNRLYCRDKVFSPRPRSRRLFGTNHGFTK